MDLFQVAKRLEDQYIDQPLGRQRPDLLAECLPRFFERSFSQGLDSGSQRANRSCDPNIEAFGGITSQADAGASLRKSWQRLLGTLVGGLLGILAVIALADLPMLYILVLGAVTAVGLFASLTTTIRSGAIFASPSARAIAFAVSARKIPSSLSWLL